MTLTDLINEAKKKDHVFRQKIEYRINGRQTPKPPDLNWLMPQLERILGAKYVREAAQAYVDKLMEEAKQAEQAEPKVG